MISSAMLYTVVVSVPVTVAAWFVARVLRSHGRAERGVWIVAIATTLIFPLFMLTRPRPAPAVTSLPTVQMELEAVAADQVSIPTALPATRSLNLDGFLLALWMALSLALSVRWALSAIRLRLLRRSWIPETIDGVPVTLTAELGPAVTGLVRPQIVVPAWVPALPPHQRALVLLHEQEHIRARDPWLNTFSRISRILSPWNPATWLLGVGLKRAVELDCDRRVLRRQPSIESYGETLLVVSARGANRLMAAAAFAETDVPLRKRILAMTTPPRAMSVPAVVGAITVGAAILSSIAAVPVPAMRIAPSPAPLPLQEDPAPRIVASAASPAPGAALASTTRAETPAGASDATPPQAQQAQQTLAEPRVIAEPGRSWIEIHRSAAAIEAGDPPLARAPWASRDSAFEAVYAMIGDSALYALRDSVLNGLREESVLRRIPLGTRTYALPSDPLPPMTAPPRILNADEILQTIRAAYPRTLLDQGRGGTVGMQFLVGATGEVERIRIAQISAYPALDEAAVQVASVYRFSPALRGDQRVAVWVAHAISFYPPD
jgi:TonB family protein